MIDTGTVNRGIGIDLDASIIDPDLLSNPKFNFLERNILDYKFDSKYDLIIFTSDYHHLFANHGKEIATSIWNKIIKNCNKYIIFETGSLLETGYPLYWKEKFLKHYQHDQEIILDLLLQIENRLEDVQVIGSNEIHYAKRPLYLITLKDPREAGAELNSNNLFPKFNFIDDQFIVLEKLNRTEGSKDQELIRTEVFINDKKIKKDILFYKLKNKNDYKMYFTKIYPRNRHQEMIEFEISKAVDFPNALRPLYISENYGLIFDYLPWKKISDVDFRKIINRREFLKEISNYFRYIYRKYIHFNNYLDILCSISNRKLFSNIIDSNFNNFMIKIDDGKITDWKVIDFGFCLKNCSTRNKENRMLIMGLIEGNNFIKLILRIKIFILWKIKFISDKIVRFLNYVTLRNLLIFIFNKASQVKKRLVG